FRAEVMSLLGGIESIARASAQITRADPKVSAPTNRLRTVKYCFGQSRGEKARRWLRKHGKAISRCCTYFTRTACAEPPSEPIRAVTVRFRRWPPAPRSCPCGVSLSSTPSFAHLRARLRNVLRRQAQDYSVLVQHGIAFPVSGPRRERQRARPSD